jgi:hypothetical protein
MGTLIIFCNEGAEMVHRKVDRVLVDMTNKRVSFEGTNDKDPDMVKWVYPVNSFTNFSVMGPCRFIYE